MRVNREEFLRALESVSAGLSSKEAVEQSTCYVFKDGRITTFNDEVFCSAETPIKKVGVAVPAKPLVDLLRKLVEDEVEVKVEGSEFLVRGKRRRAGIRMESEITLPIDSVEKPEDWQELNPEFCEALDVVSRCASSDESNFVMTCVHVCSEHIEASDNFQVVRWPIEVGVESPCLIRAVSAKGLVGLGVSEMAETESWIHFRNPSGLVYGCRRWKEDYPKFDGVLDVDGSKAVLPSGLAEAVEKAGIFSEDGAIDTSIRVELQKGKLRLRGEGASGWYEERKTITYDGQSLSFLIAPKVLVELTKRSNECVIAPGRLKMNAGKFVYVACLGQVDK